MNQQDADALSKLLNRNARYLEAWSFQEEGGQWAVVLCDRLGGVESFHRVLRDTEDPLGSLERAERDFWESLPY